MDQDTWDYGKEKGADVIGEYSANFITKSTLKPVLDGDQILRLEKYRVQLDTLMLNMPAAKQLTRMQLFEESKRVNNYLKKLSI